MEFVAKSRNYFEDKERYIIKKTADLLFRIDAQYPQMDCAQVGPRCPVWYGV